jgi:endoglucanase
MSKKMRPRRLRGNTLFLVVALVAVVAVLGGMVHATGALYAAATQPTPAVVPTLANQAPVAVASQHILSVRGTHIVNGLGRPVTLVGATDNSLEFSCAGNGHFQVSDFLAMRSWGMNTVRISLSSAFWRDLDGTCPDYASTITAAVAKALSAGLYVILTLQWNAPFSLPQDATTGGTQCPLPDATYDARFWQDIAEIYQDEPRVIFDLFSEPHDIDWSEWAKGGTISSTCANKYPEPHTYQAIGMPELASVVRAIAPSNIIILSGIGWGYDLSGIQSTGLDLMENVLYGTHPFNHGTGIQQPAGWRRAFGSAAAQIPVIATEFGAYDCRTNYISKAIAYFERLRISFVAWAWTPGSCSTPSLLANWFGVPSEPYGAYIQREMLLVSKGSA